MRYGNPGDSDEEHHWRIRPRHAAGRCVAGPAALATHHGSIGREVAANFKTPPHEYGAIQPFASWNGPDANDRMARIVQDLDRLKANGVFIVNMSPGRGEPKYLSPEHMDQVKFVVQEAAKRGMKLWIQDEYDYPSGFAGGKVSEQYPRTDHAGARCGHTDQRHAGPDADHAHSAGCCGCDGAVRANRHGAARTDQSRGD